VKATDGDQENNDQFSDCSKESISDVIFAHSSGCFEEATSFTCGSSALVGGSCGNGLIDVNEECECNNGNDIHCNCATCEIVVGKECDAASGDPCCHANGTLMGLTLTETIERYRSVLNTTASNSIADINAALDAAFDQVVPCSAGAECTMNRYCVKDTRFVGYTGQDIGSCPQIDFMVNMHNTSAMAPTGAALAAIDDIACYNLTESCPSTDLTECAATYSSCLDAFRNNITDGSPGNGSNCYMFHMSDDASCNSGNSLCRFNGCTGSICGTFARVDGGSGEPTRCRITDDEAKSCHLACNFGGPEGCVSTHDFNATYPNATTGVPALILSPGRSCTVGGDEFGGRCSASGCQALTTPFANSLTPSAVSDWIQENWPLVLGLVLGAILLGVLLKVTYVKKKPQIKAGLEKAAGTIRRRTGMPQSSRSVPVSPFRSVCLPLRFHWHNFLPQLSRFDPRLFALCHWTTRPQCCARSRSSTYTFPFLSWFVLSPPSLSLLHLLWSSASSAVAMGERPPLTSAMRHELRQKMKKEEAEERMKAFFPKTDERVVKSALKRSRNEEEAVKYLLKKSEPFAVPQHVPLLE
jgi:hypothetical protein